MKEGRTGDGKGYRGEKELNKVKKISSTLACKVWRYSQPMIRDTSPDYVLTLISPEFCYKPFNNHT